MTPRQEDVIQGILEGLSNAEIAKYLSMQERTVKSYVGRIYGLMLADHLLPPRYRRKPQRFHARIAIAIVAHEHYRELCPACSGRPTLCKRLPEKQARELSEATALC